MNGHILNAYECFFDKTQVEMGKALNEASSAYSETLSDQPPPAARAAPPATSHGPSPARLPPRGEHHAAGSGKSALSRNNSVTAAATCGSLFPSPSPLSRFTSLPCAVTAASTSSGDSSTAAAPSAAAAAADGDGGGSGSSGGSYRGMTILGVGSSAPGGSETR